jgi:haloalkane dehalogenase
MTQTLPPAQLSAPATPALPARLAELYPFQTRTALIGGERMSFVELGSPLAPPVLLLHGNPTWSFLWRTLLPRLAERYRVIAPDWIGFGLSSKPADASQHGIACHSADLAALIAALDAENSALRAQKLMLVMHDWAGPIGLDFAARHPQRIRKLVLVNSWLAPSAIGSQVRLKPALQLSFGGRLVRWADSALGLSLSAAVSTTGNQALAAPVVDAYKFPFRRGSEGSALTGPRAFFRMTELCSQGNLVEENTTLAPRQELSAITAPVEILWGAKDPLCGKFAALTLQSALPGAREPLCLDYHGHMLPEETPEALLTRIFEEVAKPQPTLRILL